MATPSTGLLTHPLHAAPPLRSAARCQPRPSAARPSSTALSGPKSRAGRPSSPRVARSNKASEGFETTLQQKGDRLVDCDGMTNELCVTGLDGYVVGHAMELGALHRNPAVVWSRQDKDRSDGLNRAASRSDTDGRIQWKEGREGSRL